MLDVLTTEILIWASERGITNADLQALRVAGEAGEVAQAQAIRDNDNLMMEIGDVYVTIAILAWLHGWNLSECVTQAVNKIQNRKTISIDGTAVKVE